MGKGCQVEDGSVIVAWTNNRVVSIARGLIGWWVGWDPAVLLNPYMLVVDASGWGKTGLLRRLVRFT